MCLLFGVYEKLNKGSTLLRWLFNSLANNPLSIELTAYQEDANNRGILNSKVVISLKSLLYSREMSEYLVYKLKYNLGATITKDIGFIIICQKMLRSMERDSLWPILSYTT